MDIKDSMRIVALIAALLLGAPASAEVRAAPESAAEVTLSFAPVVRRAAPAVVNVYTRKLTRRRASPFAGNPFFDQFLRDFGAPPRRRVENSLGSGVIMRPDGVVVTNAHVVENAVEIRVALTDRREFDAEAIFFDKAIDLAVLRLKGAHDLPSLELRDPDTLEVGDLALAIGNPFGVGQTVTSGIISGLARKAGMRGGGYFVQTDAAINPGNSGGALVDMQGRLIGVNTAILSRGGGSVGIGFAIPSSLVARAVESALSGATALVQPWSGVRAQQVTDDIARAMGLKRAAGVVIAGVHPLSPMLRAGLQVGDVVVALNGDPVDTVQEFQFRLAALGVGGQATVGYLRRGEAREAVMDLAPPPRELRN